MDGRRARERQTSEWRAETRAAKRVNSEYMETPSGQEVRDKGKACPLVLGLAKFNSDGFVGVEYERDVLGDTDDGNEDGSGEDLDGADRESLVVVVDDGIGFEIRREYFRHGDS